METTSKISQSPEKENNSTQAMSQVRHRTVIDYFANNSVVGKVDLLACNDSQNISTQVDKGESDKKPSYVIEVIPNSHKSIDPAEQTSPIFPQGNAEITPVQLIENLLEDKEENSIDEKMEAEASNLPVPETKVIAEEIIPTRMVEGDQQPEALATENNIDIEVPIADPIHQQTEEELNVNAVVVPTKEKSIKKSISKLKRKVLRRRNNLYRNIKSKINTYIRGSKRYRPNVKPISKKLKAKVNKPTFMPFKRTTNSTILRTNVYQNYPKSEIKRKRKPAVPKFRNNKKTIKRFN